MSLLKIKYGLWALITGASAGIGKEFAKRLAKEGMNLILVARRKEKLTPLSKELIGKYQVNVIIVPIDLTKDDFVSELKEVVADREVGILINNAGSGVAGDFSEIDLNANIEMIKLNCIAPSILTYHFIKPMIDRNKGAVIFLGSMLAYQPTPLFATYATTKVFNAHLGGALWHELKKHNIDVLTVNPGTTKTEFQSVAGIGMGPFARQAKDVVDTTMKALGKKVFVTDGFINKFVAFLTKVLPSKLVIKATGLVAGKLYQQD